MPRFVVLSHDHPEPHFDLMLEADGVLRRDQRAAIKGVRVRRRKPAGGSGWKSRTG